MEAQGGLIPYPRSHNLNIYWPQNRTCLFQLVLEFRRRTPGGGSKRAGRKFEKMMVYTDIPVPCTDAKVSRKYTSQNSDVARCSMKKDVWSNPFGKRCLVNPLQ